MERVSGWYRRRIQVILAVIATVLVVLLNADTLASARVLWRADAVAPAVVQKAEASAEEQADRRRGRLGYQAARPAARLGTSRSATRRRRSRTTSSAGSRLLGLALSVAAVLLGAPFWFDLLGKVARLQSGRPPATDAIRSGDADQKRAGSTAPAIPLPVLERVEADREGQHQPPVNVREALVELEHVAVAELAEHALVRPTCVPSRMRTKLKEAR